MTAGKKLQRLMIVVVVGLITIAGQAQTKDSVLTFSENPFVTSTVITIHDLTNDTISLKIYDRWGNKVADFFENIVLSGTVSVTFNADTLLSNLYVVFFTLNSADFVFNLVKTSSANVEVYSFTKELTVYPNPALDKIFIKSTNDIKEIRIFDCNGRKVLEQKNDYNNGIDLTDLKKGIYLLHVVTKDKLFIEKVIKQ